MAIVQCLKGHYYDDEKFFCCPYCGISLEIENADEKTISLQDLEMNEDERTIAYWGYVLMVRKKVGILEFIMDSTV